MPHEGRNLSDDPRQINSLQKDEGGCNWGLMCSLSQPVWGPELLVWRAAATASKIRGQTSTDRPKLNAPGVHAWECLSSRNNDRLTTAAPVSIFL